MSAFLWERPSQRHVAWWFVCGVLYQWWSLLSFPLNVTPDVAWVWCSDLAEGSVWSKWLREVWSVFECRHGRLWWHGDHARRICRDVFRSASCPMVPMLPSALWQLQTICSCGNAKFIFAFFLFLAWLLAQYDNHFSRVANVRDGTKFLQFLISCRWITYFRKEDHKVCNIRAIRTKNFMSSETIGWTICFE